MINFCKELRKHIVKICNKNNKNNENNENKNNVKTESNIIKILLLEFNKDNAIKLVNIEHIEENKEIYAELEYRKHKCSCNYMDTGIRRYCTELAIFLRDEMDRNCYFDIENGNFRLITS